MGVAVPHLRERQTVLVCLLVFELEVIKGFTLGGWLGQRLYNLDKVGGEKAVDSTHFPVVPVFIDLSA